MSISAALNRIAKQAVYGLLALESAQPLVRSQFYRSILRKLPPETRWPLLRTLKGEVSLRVSVAGMDFSLITSSKDDHFVNAWLDGLTKWEVAPLAAWRQVCQQAQVVIDVGAYSGVYSITAALAGAKRVIAYEPNPASVGMLHQNIQENGLKDRVDVRECALSEKSGSTEMIVPIGREGSSGAQLAQVSTDRDLSNWETACVVSVVRLDDDVAPEVHVQVEAIKIDAEGNELRVLQGAEGIFAVAKPVIFVECLSGRAFFEVTKYLEKFGYVGTPLDGAVPDPASIHHSAAGTATNFQFR